ncbi:MAG: hypothetical protein B7Z08_07440 [Sphingomonadales bacterium 32-68-7]|nr:MAG: hypothetical protein B7Z33_06835 [Sphingomonadales bacterium 12-68-11]OYX08905.1 MAG: hypothetical protein B7Z08_07440 [Sphingomonadales bacterium 32-68-7]
MSVAEGRRPDEDPVELDEFGEEDELAFPIENDRLPWLDSDDEPEDPGLDTGRIAAFALVGVLALAALIGGLWWLTREPSGPTLVAEGGTIEAPAAPYKEKPADPGGREVAGTGDTSFAVAEGRTVESRVADASPEPVRVPAATAGAPRPAPSASVPASTGGVGVQVGAYSRREQAEAGWQQLAGRLAPLQGRSHRVVEGVVDGATVYRLQAVAGSLADADTLCRAIKAAGGDCQVKR